MRQLLVLIILFILISCNIRSDSNENLKNYMLGLNEMENIQNNSKIDYPKAIEYFDKSILENPNHIESRYWKMQCEIKLGKFSNALEISEFVINNSEMANQVLTTQFYIAAGLIEKINGNSKKSSHYFLTAIENYNLRIEKDINDIDAIMNKAIILCYMNKKEEAIRYLDSISLNEDRQVTLKQIRNEILDFDSDKIINELKANRN